jgi:hypothetical protein
MPEERIPKLIMAWIPEKRRKRGCPRKVTKALRESRGINLLCVLNHGTRRG